MFSFSVLDQKNPFLGKSVQKNQNCQFKLKFGTKTNLYLWNSMTFTFFIFDHKYRSWANLVQKFKIVCSKWNLIQRLIRICKIQWWCLFYLFWTENSYPLLANLVQKIAAVSLSWKLVLRLIMKNSIVIFIFFSFRPEVYFFRKFVPKIKLVEAEI